MKCLCDFNQKPENIVALRRHVEDCMTTGILQQVTPDPMVVWRNRQFMVVTELQENEVAIDSGIVRPNISRIRIENKIAAEKIIVDFDGDVQEIIEELNTGELVVDESAPATQEKVITTTKAPAKKKKS